jgi:flagellar motility protein MotE (MotC chaperone)
VLTETVNNLDKITARFELIRDDLVRFNFEIAAQLESVGLADDRNSFVVQWPDRALPIVAARRQVLLDRIAALRGGSGAAEPSTLADVTKKIADLKAQLQMSDTKRKQYEKFLKDKEQLNRSIQALEKEITELKDVVAPRIKKLQMERLDRYVADIRCFEGREGRSR